MRKTIPSRRGYSDDTYKGALMANIWVVDDDLFYRKLISEELKAYGHDVMTLHNGMNLLLRRKTALIYWKI